MTKSVPAALLHVLGVAVGAAIGYLAARRPGAARWFEIAVLLLLALGWIGTAVALRRRAEVFFVGQQGRLSELAARIGALGGALRVPAPAPLGALPAPGGVPSGGDGGARIEGGALPSRDTELEPVASPPDGSPAPHAGEEAGDSTSSGEEPLQPRSWEGVERAAGYRPQPAVGSFSAPAESLVGAWQAYLERGDGRFTSAGLQRCLDEAGLDARVVPPESLPLSPDVLAVEERSSREVFLLPNFNATVRAVEAWFQPAGPRSLTARIQGLVRPARVRLAEGRVTLAEPGAVE